MGGWVRARAAYGSELKNCRERGVEFELLFLSLSFQFFGSEPSAALVRAKIKGKFFKNWI